MMYEGYMSLNNGQSLQTPGNHQTSNSKGGSAEPQ